MVCKQNRLAPEEALVCFAQTMESHMATDNVPQKNDLAQRFELHI